ncbi:MAG: rubrerythrin family protein [Candidatus Hodarchaeales archaeon]|jgi:rubrerythrin
MKEKTDKNLQSAFAGESQANTKYLVFSDKAEKEGFPNVARLFRANSFAEQIHATRHLRTLGGIKSTSDNLQTAIDGETYEFTVMYPEFIDVAKEEEEKSAIKSFEWAMEAEKIHESLYSKAKDAVDGGKDADISSIFICPNCGYTHEGDEVVDKCPLCNLAGEKFIKF